MLKPFNLARLLQITYGCMPFIGDAGQVFVTLPEPKGRILPIRSPEFRNWFYYRAVAHQETIPSLYAFRAILHCLEARASEHTEGTGLAVFHRVGGFAEHCILRRIILDLANSRGEYVEIVSTGWKTISSVTDRFQTSPTTCSLPHPDPPQFPVHSRVGEPAPEPVDPNAPVPWTPEPAPDPLAPEPQSLAPLEVLRSILNLPSRPAFLRVLAWLLAALRPYGPFPFLILQGPPSSGKTFAARVLHALLDSNTVPLAPTPATVRDLHNIARHNWIVALDHVSKLSPAVADALCRLSSGLGAAVHETARPTATPLLLYYKRPVILTVTEGWTCPPALAERAFTVTLPPLEPDRRRTETALLRAFNQAWPGILGALCNAVSRALASGIALAQPGQTPLPSTKFADAAAWAIAASPALDCTEEEMRQALTPPPPPHPMVAAVRTLMEQRHQWKGTATELRDLLQPGLSCNTPKGVSHQLKTCMLTLADHGIELKFRRLHGGARVIEINDDPGDAWSEKNPPHASPDFAAPPQPAETEEVKS